MSGGRWGRDREARAVRRSGKHGTNGCAIKERRSRPKHADRSCLANLHPVIGAQSLLAGTTWSSNSTGAAMKVLIKPDAAWRFTIYPTAGEAGGAFVPSMRRSNYVPPGFAADPLRARQVAAARARGRVRRYSAANGLDRFGTLTYAPPGTADSAEVRAHAASFMRNLRESRGKAFPYVWVPERHKSGLFHLHFALGEYVPRSQVNDAWGRGFVSIKQLSGQRIGAPRWEAARTAGRYMAKYVAKTFGESEMGRHRYEVGQGFQPPSQRIEATSFSDAMTQMMDVMEAAPARVWSSDEDASWVGPPAGWAQ